jgi:NAD(P)-dependent dehydrogenase (short-subunit alcohol dehydrogenase family)
MNEQPHSSPGGTPEPGAMVVTGGTDGIGRATALHLARGLSGLELLSRTGGMKIAVSVIRPGMVRTHIRQKSTSLPWYFFVFEWLTSLFGHSAEVSARTPFLLASDPSARSLSGHYVGPSIRTLPRIPRIAKEYALRARLWEVSEKLVREHL